LIGYSVITFNLLHYSDQSRPPPKRGIFNGLIHEEACPGFAFQGLGVAAKRAQGTDTGNRKTRQYFPGPQFTFRSLGPIQKAILAPIHFWQAANSW